MASPSPFIPLAPDTFSGRKLGKYEIVCRLSTGGMSEIFLAFQRGVGGFRKWVVLKQILPDIKGEEEFVRMFLDEAKITAAFNHPNIAHVFDLDIADGELFLSMEFVPGATLVEIARMCRLNSEPIPIGMTLQSVRDTALALHYAHNFTDPLGQPQSVIHRDIAEKNIMVTYEGTTKLLDFGIAKSHSNSGRTMVGMVKGTSGYMSPEQILGEKLDGRSDIFSLGVVLHECLTGMRLFHAKTPEQGMLAPLRETVNPPSKQNPLVTPEIDAVVLKSLKRTREERHSSALEFARDLEAAAGPLIWRPEQTAPFVQRLFAERREQTRQLLSNATLASAEHTGEIRLKQFLQGDAPPSRPSLSRQPPVPPPLPELVESDESTDPLRDKNLISLPQRRQSSPEIPRSKPNLRAQTEEVTNPNGPPQKNAQRDFESTAPIIKPPPPVYDSFSEPSEEEPEAQTILNRPNELMQFLDPSVKAKLPQYDAEELEPPPVEQEPEAEQASEDDGANTATEWDRDADDAEDEEVRTIVQPPVRPRSDGDTGEHDTVSAVAPPKSSKKWVAVMLVLLVAGGAGAAWKLGYLGKAGDMEPVPEKPLDVAKKHPPVVKKEEKKEEPKKEEKVVVAPNEAAKPDSGLATAQQTPPPVLEVKKEEPKLPPVEEKKQTPPPVIEKVVEAKKDPPPVVEKKKTQVKKVVAKVEKKKEEPKEAPPPVEKADANATGQLTLVTTPWAKVQFKAQDLGVTPLFKVSLPVGKHTLKLTGPDNQVIMLPVEIKDGQVTTLRQKLADLQQ